VYSNNNYRVGSGAVELLLAFQQNLRKEFNHPVQVLQPGMSVRLNTLNYGFRYNAPAILNFETTLGVNGMYQSNTNYNATDFPIPDYYLLDVGTYGIFKWKYNQWTLSGGARFDSRSLNAPNFYVKNNPLTGFSQKVNLPDTAAYLQFPAFQHKFNGLSMSMGLTYMLNSHLYVKANVARAFRAPSITELASNGLDPGAHIVYIGNKNFNPEFSFQQDIGVNAYYENFTAVVSFFNNNIENYIYLAQKVNANGTPVEIVPGNKTFQYQQSTAQLYGFETSLNIQPKVLKGFSFSNSMAFTNGYNRKSEYKNTGIKGEYLPLIPPFKVLNTLNQEIKLNNKIIKILNVKVEVDYNAHQTRYLSLYNTETYTPGYTLINTGAGFEVNYFKKYRLIVQIQINNLFNTVYQSNLSRLKYFEYYQQSPNGHLGIFNMGRNICFKVILPL
jgi:iron complex outermembrane receptor protein